MTRLQAELRERLFEALERREMSQAALARAIGVSAKHLNQMLNGAVVRRGTDRDNLVEGTLPMWQDCFDALGYRVDVKIVRKPKVEV